jgi:uncharacterized Zn-finger protein
LNITEETIMDDREFQDEGEKYWTVNEINDLDMNSQIMIIEDTLKNVKEGCRCLECDALFSKRYSLNRHSIKKHIKPYKCDRDPDCHHRFGTRKDLNRHTNDIHEHVEIFYCPYDQCKYSEIENKGFSRKANRDRHVKIRHQE